MHADLERALKQFEENERAYEAMITRHMPHLNERSGRSPEDGRWLSA
jgi:hypothetical protein